MATDAIKPAGDPQIGNLETPINSSGLVTGFIGNLPIYRPGLEPQRRGLEIGMAHGYLLYGPFTLLGPLRDSGMGNLAGMFAAAGLVLVLSTCLKIYGKAGISQAIATATTPKPPEELMTGEGWMSFTKGFLIGGLGGAVFAYGVFFAVSLVS